MAKLVRFLSKSAGLNNKFDPSRVEFNAETGVSELIKAINVDIDESGRISRRKGFVATSEGSAIHSLFAKDNIGLYIKESSLMWLYNDYSSSVVRSDLTPGLKMGYVKLGDSVYYCNTAQKGIAREGKDYAWEKGTYIGPTTKKEFSDPPLGRILEIFSGRMYIGLGNVVWYSERFAYGRFNRADNFILLEGDVRGIVGVTNGLYVGLDCGMYFLEGMTPNEFKPVKVSEAPVVAGSMAKIDGTFVGEGKDEGKFAVWTTIRGVYLGNSVGRVSRATPNLVLPSSNSGSSLVIESKYLCLMED